MTDAKTARPARLTREESKERTRETLIATASQLFLHAGYQGTTLDAIAAEAGFTKGAVYWHFRNKEALFLELLQRQLQDQIRALDSFLARATQDPRVLAVELPAWVDALDEQDVPLLALELMFETRRNPAFAQSFAAVIERHQAALTSALAGYFELTGKRPPMAVDVLARTIVAMSSGLALAREARGDRKVASSGQIIRILLDLPPGG